MGAQPTHDLTIKTGEYNDRQTGETKGRWLKIGTVFRHDDGGTSIKLDCLPVGLPDWNGWVNVFPRTDQQGNGAQAPRAQHNGNGNGQAYRQQQAAPPGYPQQPPPQAYQQPPAPATRFDDDVPF